MIYRLRHNIGRDKMKSGQDKIKSPNGVEILRKNIECKKLELMQLEADILGYTPKAQNEAQDKFYFVCQVILKNHDFDVDFFAEVAAECLVFMNGMRSKDSTRRHGKARPGALSTSLGGNRRVLDAPSSASLKPVSETLTGLEPNAPGSASVS